MSETVTLTHIPSSARTLWRAMTTFGRNGRSMGELPQYHMAALAPDPKRLQAFNALFGYSGEYVPSTYWHTRLFGVRIALAARRDFPFPLPGMVHLTDTIRQHAPVRSTDVLRMECGLGRVLAHEKGTAFETLTRLYRDGQLVWEENTVNLHIGQTGFAQEEYRSYAFPDLAHPQETPLTIAGNMGRTYAKISGDFNPIHISTVGAKLFGFRQKIMHGWYGLNKILATHPEAMDAPHELYVAFKKPLFLPGKVLLREEATNDGLHFEILNAAEGYPNLKGYLRPPV